MGSYNKLTGSDVVVLTGAGASVPLDMPAMDGFYKKLELEDTHWAWKVFDSFPEYGKDLEKLLGHLEYYEALLDIAGRDQYLGSINAVSRPHLEKVVKGARSLRERSFGTIIESYGKLNKKQEQKAVDLYKKLFEQLRYLAGGDSGVLPIFTTNYDLTYEALEEKGLDKPFCTGMSLGGRFSAWDPTLYKNQDYGYAVFRLHGCSHWMREKGTGEVVFQAIADRAKQDIREPVVLYPVPGKDDKIGEEPFATAYQYFEECLESARTIVLIGYSGRDVAIQNTLRLAFAADPSKVVVVVSKDEENLLPVDLKNSLPSGARVAPFNKGIEGNQEKIVKAVKGGGAFIILNPSNAESITIMKG